ncbi:EutP/PduV family microcompartment system protein [Caminicella sporogenes]|nr:EutP/PduV family microcompartment system protein [Caminicella sporogenes]WIF95541.1 EutP/PduV family microcompartment system protein [Caminicella sporogenes]
MKKMILIGRTHSGKTTLIQVLNKSLMKYKKTQTIEYHNNILDTPGEYIENRRFYNALIISSFDCDVIGLVQDCTDCSCIFPPNFVSMFNKEVIGIITKIDCKEGNIKYAEKCLHSAGVSKVFKISSIKGYGIENIKKYLYRE